MCDAYEEDSVGFLGMFALPWMVSRERTPTLHVQWSCGYRVTLWWPGGEGHLDKKGRVARTRGSWGQRSSQCPVPGDLVQFYRWYTLWSPPVPCLSQRVIACTINGACHGGCHNAGESCARPKLQHGASLEEVPSEQDIVGQEQGTPPHLQQRGHRTTGDLRFWRDPQEPQEVDRAYSPACLHPPGVWPWYALDRTEIERETSMVKWS